MLDQKTASIVAQVAAKAAAELYAGTGNEDGYMIAVEVIHNDLLSRLDNGVVTPAPQIQAVPTEQVAPVVATVANIKQAFPDAQDVSPKPPVPIGPNSKAEDMWHDAIYHNQADYKVWNTPKSSMNGGTSQDVQHETVVNAKGYKHGFWLVSGKDPKLSAPKWVWEGLGLQAEYQSNLAAGKVI
jgi:hypothetical protein